MARGALQALSVSLNTEQVLSALPPMVRELVVVQHGATAAIPVHALPLAEDGLQCVADSYAVRYSTSVHLLELCERQAVAALQETPSYYNGCCCIVAKPDDKARQDKTSASPSSIGSSGSTTQKPSSAGGKKVLPPLSPGGGSAGTGDASASMTIWGAEVDVVSSVWEGGNEDFKLVTAQRSAAYGTAGRRIGGLGGTIAYTDGSRVDKKESFGGPSLKLERVRCLHLCCPLSELQSLECLFGGTTSAASADGANDSTGVSPALSTARQLLAQLTLKHCGLLVLSHGGLLDECIAKTAGASSPLEGALSPVDSLLATGVQTVLCCIWGGEELAAVNVLLLLVFHRALKDLTRQGELRPVSRALREAMLCIKGYSLKDLMALLESATGVGEHHKKAVREALLQQVSGRSSAPPFSSPLFWAGFQVHGSGTAVQSLECLGGSPQPVLAAHDAAAASSSAPLAAATSAEQDKSKHGDRHHRHHHQRHHHSHQSSEHQSRTCNDHNGSDSENTGDRTQNAGEDGQRTSGDPPAAAGASGVEPGATSCVIC
eukprot:TRINITY_DN5159_c0_g1_i1.p1 TRINITY_DN5159_c0_g1~~TRINITY_DN5159_c0_g1_i1.p1  ORF type:complete len:546 (+),score=72.37 TRINITY_DN5159_c0_g1_i1:1325-2962(+)